MFDLILWGLLLFVVAMQYVQIRSEATFRKNIALGVTLPGEAREDAGVQAILRRFLREEKAAAAVLAVLVAVCALLPGEWGMLLWGLLLLTAILLPAVLFWRGCGRLRALKKARGWQSGESGRVRVDVSAIAGPERPCWPPFLPPVFICLLLLIVHRAYRPIHAICLAVTVLCLVGRQCFYRRRGQQVDANGELTRALGVLHRRNWNRLWLVTSYAVAGLSAAQLLAVYSAAAATAAVLAVAIALAAVTVFLELRTRRAQELLTASSGRDWYVDEDDFWIGGMLYFNPNDSHLMVSRRVGMGSTINLARPAGKVLGVISLILLLSIPAATAALTVLDNAPITAALTDTALRCENAGSVWEVPLGEITSAELTEDLPENLYRVSGIGGRRLIRGRFSAAGMPRVEVLADPNEGPYLLLSRTDGRRYLLGLRRGEDTRALYEALLARCPVS